MVIVIIRCLHICPEKGELACDIQWCVRYEENREIVYHDWADKHQYIPNITYLKADAREAEVLTGRSDREEAAKIIVSWGPRRSYDHA